MGGGAERVFSVLLQHLDRNCFEPHLAVLQGEGPYIRDLPPDVHVHDLQLSRVRYALPAVVRLVWRLQPQTVISTLRNMNMLLIVSKAFLPRHTRIVVRESALASPTLKHETDRPRLWRWLYRHLYKHADHVIALSDAMAADLVENFSVPTDKIVRIYNPVDSRRVRELAELGDSPYSGPGPHLVGVGRFTREKGFDILLDALPEVVRRFPTADLVILGEGPLGEQLRNQARQLGLLNHVRLPGFDPNPWRYFRHADLFILPSRYEGLPNVLLEALAVGVSVVATDCPGGVRDVQACDPEMTMVPPENPEALARAIISACERFKKRSGSSERSLPDLSRFDLQQIVAEYSRLF
jgi:glycosyltransferase involved in cell wall biosynthesis